MSWRFSIRTTALVLLGWAVVAILLSWRPIVENVEFVRAHHPDLAVLFWVALVFVSAILPVGYHHLLRSRLLGYEPLVFAVVPLAFALFYEPAAAGISLLMVGSCFAVGRWAMERLNLQFPGPVSELAVSTGLGLAAFSWLLFFIGIAGGYQRWAFLLLLVVPCLALPRQIRVQWAAIRGIGRRWIESEDVRHPYGALLVSVFAVVTLCAMLVMLAPTITFDALKFHLPLAEHYASTGRLDVLDSEVYSFYPQGVEVLMAVGAGLAGQAGAQMIPVIFFPLMLAVVFAILRECGGGTLGALSGVAFTTAVPYLHWTGANPKNDVAMAFYQLAAFWCYLRWRRDQGIRWILVGVFFVAASCGVKLTTLFGVVALIPLFVFAWWRQRYRLRNLAAIVLVFGFFGTVWQAHDWALTGNPVYPQGVENPVDAATIHPRAVSASQTNRLYRPWRMIFGGSGFAVPEQNPVGLAMIVFLPLWLLVRGRRTPWECWIFLAIYLPYWIYLFPILRFAIAAVGLLIALLGARAAALSMSPRRGLRYAGYIASSFAFLFSMCVLFKLEVNAPQFGYFAGRWDKSQFLSEALLTYPSLEFLKDRAEAGVPIFGVNNCSRAYAPEPEFFACEYAQPDADGLALIDTLVSSRDYRYLILPSGPGFAPLVESLSVDRTLDRIYGDSSFEVYRMTDTSRTGSQSTREIGWKTVSFGTARQ